MSDPFEIWRVIPGHEPYEASTFGRVRRAGRIIAQFPTRQGYMRLGLSLPGVGLRRYLAHRLVAFAFLEESRKPTVNHIDGRQPNNGPFNLEWATRSEQQRHSLDVLGFQPPRGEQHWNAKKTSNLVREVRRRVAAGETRAAVARDLGLPPSNVSRIANGKSWAHLGLAELPA